MAHPKNDHRHSRFLQPRRPLQTLYPQVRRHVITPDGLDEGIPSEGSKNSLDREGRRVLSTTQEGSHVGTHPPSPPRMGQPFIIDPDSSQYSIGAVLQLSFQDPDGRTRLHPIAYESKKLTETEQRYATQEKELLAAKYALNHWRHFVEGSEIHIRTDHESLRTKRNGLASS